MSSGVGRLHLSWSAAESEHMCHDVLFGVRDFADRVVGIGLSVCKRLQQPICYYVSCYESYVMSDFTYGKKKFYVFISN